VIDLVPYEIYRPSVHAESTNILNKAVPPRTRFVDLLEHLFHYLYTGMAVGNIDDIRPPLCWQDELHELPAEVIQG
jgi:hypothetical protein